MARAGFYAVESGTISFRRDGHWYNDDERIENPRIAMLFSQSIRRNPDGSYFLQVAEERAPITVEDTPYVVTTIEDDGRGGIVIVTNDDAREALDAATLEVGADNVLYCRIKRGEFRARFLRTAYYHLADYFVTDDGVRFSLLTGSQHHPIKIAPPDGSRYDPHSPGVGIDSAPADHRGDPALSDDARVNAAAPPPQRKPAGLS
jgi:uncharacterized protein